MRISTDRKRILYICIFSVSALLVALSLKLFPSPPSYVDSPWEAYRVHAFPVPIDDNRFDQIVKAFSRHGYSELIHRRNQKLHFFTYEGEQSGTIEEVKNRFERGDPVYDPYMRRVEAYFEGRINGKPAELIYVRDTKSSARSDYRLHRELEEINRDFEVLGVSFRMHLYFIAVVLGVALLLLPTVGRRNALLYLAGILPIMLGMKDPSFLNASLSILLTIGWALFVAGARIPLREFLDIGSRTGMEKLRRVVLVYCCIVGASLLLVLVTPKENSLNLIYQQLLSVLAHIGVIGIYVVLYALKSRRYEHIPFYPKEIKTEKRILEPRCRFALAGVLVAVALLPFFFSQFLTIGGDITMPVPVDSDPLHNERGFSWESLGRLNEETARTGREGWEKESRLPDLSDYLSHRAYQQSYFYGRGYGFPEEEEKVSLTDYSREGIFVKPVEKVVKIFTDQWYEDIIGEAHSDGVTRLLLSQKGPIRVRKERVEVLHVTKQSKWGHAGVYTVVIPLLFMAKRRKQKGRYLSEESRVMRRGRKVA